MVGENEVYYLLSLLEYDDLEMICSYKSDHKKVFEFVGELDCLYQIKVHVDGFKATVQDRPYDEEQYVLIEQAVYEKGTWRSIS